jgi:hypothetical protein
MRYISNEYKEGYVAFVFGVDHVENPYDVQEIKHYDWAAGWLNAKLAGATKHPDQVPDSPHEDTFVETRTEIANSVLQTLSAEQREIESAAQYHILTEYYTWLETLDKRAKEVILALDTDPPSGSIGARSKFYGQLEAMLLQKATGGRDFVDLYVQIMSGPHGKHKEVHREEGARIWNITTLAIENYFSRIARKFNES